MRPGADTLLLWTGAPCTSGCATCPIDPARSPAPLQPDDVQRLLADAGGRLVVLVGGEPFLRPDLLRILAALRAAGGVPGIVTTGRPLVYPRIRERLRRIGLGYLRVQLFGVGEAHDRATGVPGAFAEVLTGLRAWFDEAADTFCDVDVALTARQRPHATLAAELEALAQDVPDAARLVIGADDHAALHDVPAASAAWAGVAVLSPAFVGPTPASSCLGTTAALVAAATADGDRTRANSYNYVRTATTVPWTAAADSCTAAEAAAGIDPLRQVWLIEGHALALHTSDTGDFDAAELARIKDERSHVFVDRAAAGVLDDFVEGMRRVRPDPVCAGCARRSVCGHRFALVDGAPFAREEACIAGHVAALTGRVLDVGCGEQMYRAELEPLVHSGTVIYTGLDPDAPSLDRLRPALPEARFFLGGIEDFRDRPASYDHILCLRSLNHVFDLDLAMSRMAALLVPSGSLIIVETTPFAMLRRPEQVAAADRAPRAGHQHFRNVDSDEVLPYARRYGLEVVHHHPASFANSNEWILLLRKT